MTIRQFTTAAKAEGDGKEPIGDPIQIEVDERPITFYAPTGGQLAVAMAEAAGYNGTGSQAAASINFFFSLLEDDDADWFKGRLFDRKDPFDIEEIGALSKDLMEEWSGTPIKQPSDFAPSQSSTGPRSTGKQRKQVRHHRSA